MKLIKFIGFHEHLADNLKQHKLNFSNVSAFNDPFEGIFRFEVSTDRSKFLQFYLHDYSGRPELADYYFDHLEEFNTMLNRTHDWRSENNAVTCFSAAGNELNVIMWAHYCKFNGQSHNGVCLMFESKNLKFFPEIKITTDGIGISDITGPPQKVNYIKKYLSADPLDRELNADVFLRTKFQPWAYEREYRYIASRAGRYYYPAVSLQEVIFGLRLPDAERSAIGDLVKLHYPHAKLSQVKMKKGDFGFEKIAY